MKGHFILSGAEFNSCSLNYCYSFKNHVGFYLKICQPSATLARVGLTEPPGGGRLFCSFLADSAALPAGFSESLNELALPLDAGKNVRSVFFHHDHQEEEEEDSLSCLPSPCCNQNVTPTLHHRHRRLDLHRLLFSPAKSSYNNWCFIYFGTWIQLRA